MNDVKILRQFTVLTFAIAYLVSGLLILLSPLGYRVHNWVSTVEQLLMNIPFALYILSPAIASYIILKQDNRVTGIKAWLKTVFYIRNSLTDYLYIFLGLFVYFLLHRCISQEFELVLPFYTFFLSMPGNLLIGGMEEAGWMYILQPGLVKNMVLFPQL